MKTLKKMLDKLSVFNSGYDIRNRNMVVKFAAVIGCIAAILLAVMGAVHIANGQ